jgi:hypothetical protein
MRPTLLKILLLMIPLQFSIHTVSSQQIVQGLKQIFDITMDDLGNADLEVSMKLNASQWDMFKRNIGSNTSIIKREMEKALPKYFLTDFNYSEDAMDRSYKVKFKALGICRLNNNGKWEAELGSKNPDITRLSDREFVMNMDIMTNGMLIQQTQKIHLPSNAKGAKITKDSFGKAIMTYSTGLRMGERLITYSGILLIIGGGGLLYRNRQKSRNNLRVAKRPVAA